MAQSETYIKVQITKEYLEQGAKFQLIMFYFVKCA
jgi:hypothetical protein